jgi:electron transport complex protein RnfB
MKISPEQIDAILPQTQCGLCGHGGCMPYAEAMVFEQAAINLCPPGGVQTLRELGELMQQDVSPFLADMQTKAKPALKAVIREAECIGCAKCIQACPVDAIIGSGKVMHTVIADICTGCELCIPPCPVDCIDLVEVPEDFGQIKKDKANLARDRFNARNQRLVREKKADVKKEEQSKMDRKKYIEAALMRTRKSTSQA